jgi:hypothetical protein
MQQPNFNNLKDFLNNWQTNDQYFDMLSLMASLSKLFSLSDKPYLDYRLTENLFCKYYKALNDARACTAYDARINRVGIGIKTFTLKNNASTEKIAEFNKLRSTLDNINGVELAKKLGEFRNERMRISNDTYNLNETQYHIIGRDSGLLRIFNVPYETIDTNNIKLTRNVDGNIQFNDGKNEYSFNRSKTVLLKKFTVPKIYKDVSVKIIDDPLAVLEKLIIPEKAPLISETGKNDNNISLFSYNNLDTKGINYVILPLYSTRTNNVPTKSGLNQWNANGRKRDDNEVYIPVPKAIHKNWPEFFPKREEPFALKLPDGKILTSKICQSDGKALMSNPNSDLGEWILRKILKKDYGELVTMNDLLKYGIDSVRVNKEGTTNEGLKLYSIEFTNNYENYSSFIDDDE